MHDYCRRSVHLGLMLLNQMLLTAVFEVRVVIILFVCLSVVGGWWKQDISGSALQARNRQTPRTQVRHWLKAQTL